jgi:hypothetical protein
MYKKVTHTYISEKLLLCDTSDLDALREICRRASFQLRDAVHALECIDKELDTSMDNGVAPRRPLIRRVSNNALASLCWEDD